MFQNNLKIALRNLFKNKTQSTILISGLTIGMAACILLLQYVNFELSFDDFHSKKESIYRVVNERFQNGKSVQKGTITYPTIGPAMLKDYPEIENTTRIGYSSDLMVTIDDRVEPVEPGLWVDEHFLEIFDFKILASEDLVPLDETNEIILTQTLADKFFPTAKGNYAAIVGETLQLDRYGDPFKIVAICEDVPANSTIEFDLLVSYASMIRYFGEGSDNSFTNSDFYHYLELKEGTDANALAAKFEDFSQRYFKGSEVSGSEEVFSLQPLAAAHLYSNDLEYEIGRTINGRAVWSLLIIAFFILLIAWVNYVNLSSVRAIERSKEVGVRKVIGATRSQLVRQFLAEAMAVNGMSLLLAFGLVQLLVPWFAQNFNVSATALSFFAGGGMNGYLALALLGLIIGGVFISGFYPAWLLSSPHVATVLKGNFSKNLGKGWLRKGLVVFQFTMSIALISATWLVSKQIDYMSEQDLGFQVDQIMMVNSPELTAFDSTFIDRMNTLKTEFAKSPNINSATTSSRLPGERTGRIFQIRKVGSGDSEQTFTCNFIGADFEYAKTYGLEPLAGRFFRANDHSPSFNDLKNVVITQEMVKMLGYSNNEKAVGERLNFFGKDWTIVGVMPDFHQRSLHFGVKPLLFAPFYSTGNPLSINISGQNLDATIAHVKSVYEDFFPGNTFQYDFLNADFQRLYEADRRFGNILTFFTLLTIFIACLGLFGLASYTTFLRTKEIGVRKILGASVTSIITLLSFDFLKLVVIAILFAVPIAWLTMDHWLQDFAYRIELQWWMFVVAGIVAVGIAFVTVSFQSVQAAFANPVKSLKTE